MGLLDGANVAYWRSRDYDFASPGTDVPQNGALGVGGATLTNGVKPLDHDGTDYGYFPGTSGNDLTVAGLSATTTYDYTVTYEDTTTNTGSETTDGSGNLVLGGTQTNFNDKKVASISVEPSGGGAEVAEWDASGASDNGDYTDTHGLTWTGGISGSDYFLMVVKRPLLMHDGSNDVLIVSHQADLDIASGESAVIVWEGYVPEAPTTVQRPVRKRGGGTGFFDFNTTSTGKYQNAWNDGTSNLNHTTTTNIPIEQRTTLASALRRGTDTATIIFNGTEESSVSATGFGAVEPNADLSFNAVTNGGDAVRCAWYGCAIQITSGTEWTDAETDTVGEELAGAIQEASVTETIGFSDSVSAVLTADVSVSEGIGLSDSASALLTADVSVSETIGLSDAISFPAVLLIAGKEIKIRPVTGWRVDYDRHFTQQRMPGGLLKSSHSAQQGRTRRIFVQTPLTPIATIRSWETTIQAAGRQSVTGTVLASDMSVTIQCYVRGVRRIGSDLEGHASLAFELVESG